MWCAGVVWLERLLNSFLNSSVFDKVGIIPYGYTVGWWGHVSGAADRRCLDHVTCGQGLLWRWNLWLCCAVVGIWKLRLFFVCVWRLCVWVWLCCAGRGSRILGGGEMGKGMGHGKREVGGEARDWRVCTLGCGKILVGTI